VLNKELKGLALTYESRDPIVIARKFITVLESEISRYEEAKKHEGIGQKEQISYLNSEGQVETKWVTKGLDSRVSILAFNILKAGKLINDIVNPPKLNPLLQQNNQYNIHLGAANEIRLLPEDQKQEVVKFIDDKLDAARENQELPGPSHA
jgi:hypothetical protein